MFKKSRMEGMADAWSALPGGPWFQDGNQTKPSHPSPSLFHQFRTQPIGLPVWLWNLLVIGLLLELGGFLLFLASGLLGLVLGLLFT